MAIKLDGFVFDRGIDRVIRSDQRDATLPDAGHLLPTDAASKPELERLLALPNLQDYLAELLQPQIVDKNMLTNQGFQQALLDAIDTLRVAGEHAVDETDAQTLAKASKLLNEESDLRELVSLYRNALFQG